MANLFFSLHILSGGGVRKRMIRKAESDNCLSKARTKTAIEFYRLCIWGLSFRHDWAPHGEASAKVLSETWIDKMQRFFVIYTNSQEPTYVFKDEDFTCCVETLPTSAMTETASEVPQARGWLVRSLRPVLHGAAYLYEVRFFKAIDWSMKQEQNHVTIFVLFRSRALTSCVCGRSLEWLQVRGDDPGENPDSHCPRQAATSSGVTTLFAQFKTKTTNTQTPKHPPEPGLPRHNCCHATIGVTTLLRPRGNTQQNAPPKYSSNTSVL